MRPATPLQTAPSTSSAGASAAPDSMREALATLTRFSAELSHVLDEGRRRRGSGARLPAPISPVHALGSAHLPLFARNASGASLSLSESTATARRSSVSLSDRSARPSTAASAAGVAPPQPQGSTFVPYYASPPSSVRSVPVAHGSALPPVSPRPRSKRSAAASIATEQDGRLMPVSSGGGVGPLQPKSRSKRFAAEQDGRLTPVSSGGGIGPLQPKSTPELAKAPPSVATAAGNAPRRTTSQPAGVRTPPEPYSPGRRSEGRRRRREAYRSIKARSGTASSNSAPASLKTGALLDVNDDHMITHGDHLWAAPALEAAAARSEGSRQPTRMHKAVARGGALPPTPPSKRMIQPAADPTVLPLQPSGVAVRATPGLPPRPAPLQSEGFFDSSAFRRPPPSPTDARPPPVPRSPAATSPQEATPRRLAKAPRRPVSASAAELQPMSVVAEVAPVPLPSEAVRPGHEMQAQLHAQTQAQGRSAMKRDSARGRRTPSSRSSFRFGMPERREQRTSRGSSGRGSTEMPQRAGVPAAELPSPPRSPRFRRLAPLRAATLGPGRTSLGARFRRGRGGGSATPSAAGDSERAPPTQYETPAPPAAPSPPSPRAERSSSQRAATAAAVAGGTPTGELRHLKQQSYCKTGSVPGLRRTRFLRLIGTTLECYTRDLNRLLWKTDAQRCFVKINEASRKVMVYTLTARRPIVFYLASSDMVNGWSRALSRASISSLPRKYTSQKTAKELQREGIYF